MIGEGGDLEALSRTINSLLDEGDQRHESVRADENVTQALSNTERWKAERERAVALHGEAKVAAAEARYDEIFDWERKGPKSAAERAWVYRAKKRGLLTSYYFDKEDPEPGVTWAAVSKRIKRRRRREYLCDLLAKAQGGDAEAETRLRNQRDIDDFNRLADYYKRFVSAFDRATDENCRTLKTNFPGVMDDLARIWNWLKNNDDRHENGRTAQNVTGNSQELTTEG